MKTVLLLAAALIVAAAGCAPHVERAAHAPTVVTDTTGEFTRDRD